MNAVTPKDRARVRQQALRRMCRGGDGRLTRDASVIAEGLYRFCYLDVQQFPKDLQGAIDPLAMARAAGRREVYDLLSTMLEMTLAERHNPEGEA